jgi:hypothetical protein
MRTHHEDVSSINRNRFKLLNPILQINLLNSKEQLKGT